MGMEVRREEEACPQQEIGKGSLEGAPFLFQDDLHMNPWLMSPFVLLRVFHSERRELG